MKCFRSHITKRWVGLFMALYILNFSVDTPDTETDHVAEDLSINDLESVVEIILEHWLEIENAIPEHDESDTNHGTMTFKKSFDFYCFELKRPSEYASEYILKRKLVAYIGNFTPQFIPEYIPPPPKA